MEAADNPVRFLLADCDSAVMQGQAFEGTKGNKSMQMLIGLARFTRTVPERGLRKGATIGELHFRGDSQPVLENALTISDKQSEKLSSGALLPVGVATNWFNLDPVKENWLFNLHRLLGKQAEIKISAKASAPERAANIEINVWGKYGRVYQLLNRKDLHTDGTQFTELIVRGVIRRIEVNSKGRQNHFPLI